jgi:uncharacterized protein YoxC
MPKLDNQAILLAFVAVTGLAILLQAIILLAILITLRKVARSAREESEKLRSAIMPIFYETRDILAGTQGFLSRVTPQIESAAANLAEIMHGVRAQSEELQSSSQELLGRVRAQSERLDQMFSGLLDTVDSAGEFVVETVRGPARQISRVLKAAKAIVESLRTPPARRRPLEASANQASSSPASPNGDKFV